MRIPSKSQRRRGKRFQRGFTLIEMMLVLTLIGILSSFSYPYYEGLNARARRSEAQDVISKMNLYFINLYENNGSFGSNITSAYEPNPATALLGQSATWDPTLLGWTEMPFTFDGGMKMRYIYQTSSDGSSMTITAEGSVPGLGPAVPQGSLGGNYLFVETLTGPNVTFVEIPSM